MPVPRWLALAGPGAEDGWAASLGAFRRLVLVHMAARTFLLLPRGAEPDALELLIRSTTVLVGLLGLLPGAGVWAARAALALIGAELWITLPNGANHLGVELWCLFLLALFDERDDDERQLLLPGLRWFIAVFFFYTGLQKLVYGYYTQGQFLTFAAATEDRFALLFGKLLPDGELARLRSYNAEAIQEGFYRPRIGAGPYAVDSLALRALSNLVYLVEMGAGLCLLVPRARRNAAVLAIAFVVLIEVGARELTFGLLMINLLLLFVPGGWNRRLFYAFLGAYGYLVAHALGLVPLFWYSPA